MVEVIIHSDYNYTLIDLILKWLALRAVKLFANLIRILDVETKEMILFLAIVALDPISLLANDF